MASRGSCLAGQFGRVTGKRGHDNANFIPAHRLSVEAKAERIMLAQLPGVLNFTKLEAVLKHLGSG